MFHSVMISLILIAAFYFGIRYSFIQFENEAILLDVDPQSPIFAFLTSVRARLGLLFLFAASFSAVWISLYGLYLSHRIAGPIHRMKAHLKFLQENPKNFDKVHFRKKDYFDDLEEAFNEFIVSRAPKK